MIRATDIETNGGKGHVIAGEGVGGSKERTGSGNFCGADELTVMPGGFSPLYARMAEVIGFRMLFFSPGRRCPPFCTVFRTPASWGCATSSDHARHAAARTEIPIFLDADTGFRQTPSMSTSQCRNACGPVSPAFRSRTRRRQRNSGTSAGRRCIPADEAVGKIRAAVAAKDEIDPAFVICARCDLIGAEGSSFEEALERSIAYVEDGGADFIWLNSVEDGAIRWRAPVPISRHPCSFYGAERIRRQRSRSGSSSACGSRSIRSSPPRPGWSRHGRCSTTSRRGAPSRSTSGPPRSRPVPGDLRTDPCWWTTRGCARSRKSSFPKPRGVTTTRHGGH